MKLTIEFQKEKQDGGNVEYRGAFILPAKEAYERGDFRLREDAKSWYLLCEIDQSSGAINNTKPLQGLTATFNTLVAKAGFDVRKLTHHCNRSVWPRHL